MTLWTSFVGCPSVEIHRLFWALSVQHWLPGGGATVLWWISNTLLRFNAVALVKPMGTLSPRFTRENALLLEPPSADGRYIESSGSNWIGDFFSHYNIASLNMGVVPSATCCQEESKNLKAMKTSETSTQYDTKTRQSAAHTITTTEKKKKHTKKKQRAGVGL